MKKALAATLLFIGLLTASSSTSALTLADVELLISLGLLSGEQADIARQAIQATTASGGAGASVRPDEFSATECLVLNENMSRGMSGSAVTALQRFLNKQGHYVVAEPSGIYDGATYVAVMDFQLAQGLIASRTVAGAGNVGPLTREKIQQVSCAKPTTPVTAVATTTTATTTIEQSFERRERPLRTVATPTPAPSGYQMTFTPRLLKTDTKKGSYEYQFKMAITPNDDVNMWQIALTCDDGQITTNRSDLGCNESVLLRTATDGTKSLKVTFTNTTQLPQEVGVVAVALDADDAELARATFVQDLEPKTVDPVTRTASGQPLIIGAVQIPENRLCNTAEQVEYLEYIMTRANTLKGTVIVPPPCYPGDVVCTYDVPSSYCEIRGTTVNSVSMCGGTGYFYDGSCRPFTN